jgi:homoserine O-succinyltransferase/O-acetyltransferase
MLKIAILDMNDGRPNQGMRCIHNLVSDFIQEEDIFTTYNVRGNNELPHLDDFDLLISSGGPGSPIDSKNEAWDIGWCNLMDQIWKHNLENKNKKHVFLICHSFQMACRHWKVGDVSKRNSLAFGVFPTFKTEEAHGDVLMDIMPDPFWTVEHRYFQVIQPDEQRLVKMGAKVMAIEKNRPHVPYERAAVAIRFSPEIFGTQFHPEADGKGMYLHFSKPEQKALVIENHGAEKYDSLLADLENPDKIMLTYNLMIPTFLENAVGVLIND